MFTGNEDQKITLAVGSELTANFRASLVASGSPDPTIGEYFSQASLRAALDQDGCVGLRIYYGLDSSGNRTLVFVGVKADESDITSGYIGDRSYKSPPHTGAINTLNS